MKNIKRTLILFSSSEIGGAEKTLSRLANYGEENEFYLGSLKGKGELVKQNKINKIKVISFGYQRKNLLNFILSCFNSIKFSRKIKADFIYICGFKACTIIRIISLFYETPKIIHAIRWNPISNNKDDRIFRIFERLFKYQTFGWICNSKSAKNTLYKYCGIPKDRITFIYNGIEAKKPNFNKKINKNIVLTLSNFAPRKGILEYLNVIERVIRINKDVKFIIAGRDDMNGKVQREIQKKKLEQYIETPGFVDNTSDLIKISKFMVMPSLLPEGCPTSILEGMAFGKPAIGYNIEGLKELIKNNKTGYLLQKNDKSRMAKSIINLLSNTDLIEEFGYNAYNEIKKKFTLTQMLKKHRDCFNYFDNLINI